MSIRVSLRSVLNMVYAILVKWRRTEIAIGLISRCSVIYCNLFSERFSITVASGLTVKLKIKSRVVNYAADRTILQYTVFIKYY